MLWILLDRLHHGAKKIATNLAGKSNGKTFSSEHLDFIKSESPDVMTTSAFSSTDISKVMMGVWQDLYDNGCFLCCAAGNEAEEGCQDLTKTDLWKAIGACEYNKDLKRAYYSSVGEELDFMSLSGLKTTYRGKKINGTSFASPLFAGMLALVQDFFITNTGKKLNHENLEKFVIDNCIDLGDEGKDNNYGYGLFVLPDPASIDIEKYVGDNMKKRIVLKIDSKLAIVNDKAKILDVAPIIENERTMVPVRFIAEELGCKVKWNEATREVIIEK